MEISLRLRDLIHSERRAENARVHAARVLIWESDQPTDPICGWEALIDSLWENFYRDTREKLALYLELTPAALEATGACILGQ